MPIISIQLASALTGLTERTLWRRVAGESIRRGPDDARGRATLLADDIAAALGVQDADDLKLLARADTGDADAQTDAALLFLEAGKHREAVHLLRLAADQGHADAMHWLGRAYISGEGVTQDIYLGVSWLARSASGGHPISREQMEGLVRGCKVKQD